MRIWWESRGGGCLCGRGIVFVHVSCIMRGRGRGLPDFDRVVVILEFVQP